MDEQFRKVLDGLSEEALAVVKEIEKEKELYQEIERLKIKVESDKIIQINRELELLIESEEKELDYFQKLNYDLREQLSQIQDLPMTNAKEELEVEKLKLESLKSALKIGKIQKDYIDINSLEDLYEEINKLKEESAKLEMRLSVYHDLSPDVVRAKRQLENLSEHIQKLKTSRGIDLEADVSMCIASFQSNIL